MIPEFFVKVIFMDGSESSIHGQWLARWFIDLSTGNVDNQNRMENLNHQQIKSVVRGFVYGINSRNDVVVIRVGLYDLLATFQLEIENGNWRVSNSHVRILPSMNTVTTSIEKEWDRRLYKIAMLTKTRHHINHVGIFLTFAMSVIHDMCRIPVLNLPVKQKTKMMYPDLKFYNEN